MQQELLHYLSDAFERKPFGVSEIDGRIYKFLKSKNVSEPTPLLTLSSDEKRPLMRLEQWRTLLKTILMSSLKSKEEGFFEELKKNWFKLFAANLGSPFQLEQAYTLLTAHLLGIAYQEKASIFQYESGFTPLCTQEQHPFLSVPFLDWHAELGIVWGFIGHLKKNQVYLEAAQKIALWHQKNLDHEFKPFKGFLSSHHLSHYENTLMTQGTLFHLVSQLFKDPEMAYLAKEHFGWFFHSSDYDQKNLSRHTLLFLSWVDQLFKEQLTPKMPQLPEKIEDLALPLLGERHSDSSFIFSLLGMNVGLGSLKWKGVEIPAFGPQLQILGEEKLFGFLGYNPSFKELENSYSWGASDSECYLKGKLGLPQVKIESQSFDLWKYPSDWMDCSIAYDQRDFSLQVRPLQTRSSCFFVFYVSCEKCLIDGEEKLRPHSLNQYEGKAKVLSLVSEVSQVHLMTKEPHSQVKVIPLEGHQSFFGANYLIAYHLNNKYSTFEWKITPKKL